MKKLPFLFAIAIMFCQEPALALGGTVWERASSRCPVPNDTTVPNDTIMNKIVNKILNKEIEKVEKVEKVEIVEVGDFPTKIVLTCEGGDKVKLEVTVTYSPPEGEKVLSYYSFSIPKDGTVEMRTLLSQEEENVLKRALSILNPY